MIRQWHALLCCALAGAGACVGTEVGNPPFAPEEIVDPGYRVEEATVTEDPSIVGGDDLLLLFRLPAAAIPEGGTIRVVNLNRRTAAVALRSAAGVLEAQLGAALGDVLRTQLTVDGARKSPVDYRVTRPREIVAHHRQLEDCVRFEGRDLGPTADELAIVVRVRNDCDADLSFAEPTLRRAVGGLELEAASPFTVARGAVSSVRILVSASATEPAEDQLFLDLAGPVTERFAITVRSTE